LIVDSTQLVVIAKPACRSSPYFLRDTDSSRDYEGTVDTSGRVPTLETEGPHSVTGKFVRMRDIIEIKDKDHKVMTSAMRGEDGKWVTFMTMTSTRKK